MDSWFTALTQPVDTLLYASSTDFAWGRLDSGPEGLLRFHVGSALRLLRGILAGLVRRRS